MKKITLLSILIFSYFSLLAQGESNNWYFGHNSGITFNTTPPSALTDGMLDTWEGCSSISNSEGDLLFYTDGTTVFNRHHDTLVNGKGLLGHNSSTQSAVIVPLPDNPDIYYIFTISSIDIGTFIETNYSVVDMTLDGGLGAITIKNQPIMSPGTEKMTVVRHSNKIDNWIIFHAWGNNEYHAYLLSSSGLSNNPVISSLGFIMTGSDFNVLGYMKSNIKGDRIAITLYANGLVEILKFDNSTGILSNPIAISNTYPYGIEFSPNSEYLYVSSFQNSSIYQYNISSYNSSDINSSITRICVLSHNGGALQLGPDSKIYCTMDNYDYLSVINQPNNQGLSCNYIQQAIFLNGKRSGIGLPTLYKISQEEEIENSNISFPNIFTPNNDGYNDNFYPKFENIEVYKIVIYNKWGTKVFETDDITEAWDGTYEGNECSAGVYYWVATFSAYKENELFEENLRGTVDIVRE